VLREFERLPLYGFAMEQQAIRLRYDHRNRLVVERTRAVSRLRSAALRLGMDGLPKDMTTVRAVERMRCDLERVKTHDTVMVALLEELHDVLEDIERCNKRIGRVERQLRPLMGEVAPELLELKGVSTIGAAGLIGHSGDLRNCRDAAAFAMKSGTAPVQCSSGRNSSVRVNHGGNRQLNRILHTAAYMQVRDANTLGRTYYDRKRSEGKGHAAAFRALKRQLATVVFYRLKPCQGRLADAAARATA
jgi:transposase